MTENLYDLLGVTADASQEEIKKAYKKKANKYHPDKEGGDQDKFSRVSKACRVLKDPEKRAVYDETGKIPEAELSPEEVTAENLRDIFIDVFMTENPTVNPIPAASRKIEEVMTTALRRRAATKERFGSLEKMKETLQGGDFILEAILAAQGSLESEIDRYDKLLDLGKKMREKLAECRYTGEAKAARFFKEPWDSGGLLGGQ